MGFKNVGHYTIAARASYRLDGWSFIPNVNGLFYFSAHPLNPDAQLIMSEQTKWLGIDQKSYYGFRVTNIGPESTDFTVEGGTVTLINGLMEYGDFAAKDGRVGVLRDISDGQPIVPYFVGIPRNPDAHLNISAQYVNGSNANDPNLHPTLRSCGYILVNDGPNGSIVDSFAGSFNGWVGSFDTFTISPGEFYRLDNWTWGVDMGAKYFGAFPIAVPINGFSSLYSDQQSKMLGKDGQYYYGFRVYSSSSDPVTFQVGAGGFF